MWSTTDLTVWQLDQTRQLDSGCGHTWFTSKLILSRNQYNQNQSYQSTQGSLSSFLTSRHTSHLHPVLLSPFYLYLTSEIHFVSSLCFALWHTRSSALLSCVLFLIIISDLQSTSSRSPLSFELFSISSYVSTMLSQTSHFLCSDLPDISFFILVLLCALCASPPPRCHQK